MVGRRDLFERGDPEMHGGGTVEIVTLDDVVWAGAPDRDEAGSPNTVGAVALATAIRELSAVGMAAVAQHEAELTAYALERLPGVPGIRLFGDANPHNAGNRLGVLPFQIAGVSHFLVAAILGYEFGIGVRSGCFCAHPYILNLLGVDRAQAQQVRAEMLAGNKADMPGLVRASFGLYNTVAEVDALIAALTQIARGEYAGKYEQDRATGEYRPKNSAHDFDGYFQLK